MGEHSDHHVDAGEHPSCHCKRCLCAWHVHSEETSALEAEHYKQEECCSTNGAAQGCRVRPRWLLVGPGHVYALGWRCPLHKAGRSRIIGCTWKKRQDVGCSA